MFSLEQLQIFREYTIARRNFTLSLMRGEDFQAAAWDLRCDELLKIINERGWQQLIKYYFFTLDDDTLSH